MLTIFDNEYRFPVKNSSNRRPYPKVNFVFQQLFLWPHLTNRKNILLALGNPTIDDIRRFNFYTKFFDIMGCLDRYPNESSLGQKQRVAITRALILNPEFIFLDEITSALDIVQTNKIIELMLMLKENGVGVLSVTHNMKVIEKAADVVFFMQDGKIIENGGREILASPRSEELQQFLG